MKKFGKKQSQIIVHNKDNYNLGDLYYERDEDDIYEKEFSKKLYQNEIKESDESGKNSFFIFKKNKKIQNENFEQKPKIETETENEAEGNNYKKQPGSKTENKIPKLQRLSELEENNLYFSLNVDQHASKDEIKRAYKNLCYTHHPDKGGNVDNFHKIHKAYQILTNDLCKILYDKFSFSVMSLINQILTRNSETEKDELSYFKDIDLGTLDFDSINAIINMRNER